MAGLLFGPPEQPLPGTRQGCLLFFDNLCRRPAAAIANKFSNNFDLNRGWGPLSFQLTQLSHEIFVQPFEECFRCLVRSGL